MPDKNWRASFQYRRTTGAGVIQPPSDPGDALAPAPAGRPPLQAAANRANAQAPQKRMRAGGSITLPAHGALRCVADTAGLAPGVAPRHSARPVPDPVLRSRPPHTVH